MKMADFYYNKIKNGEMTLEQVPDLWRTQVEAMLRDSK